MKYKTIKFLCVGLMLMFCFSGCGQTSPQITRESDYPQTSAITSDTEQFNQNPHQDLIKLSI